jgi:ABC-2 type transport system ATP-binding protein
VEILLGGGTESTAKLPPSWLNVEMAGRVLRFTDSQFNESELHNAVNRNFPNASQFNAAPMSLREIFVALARTYRLNGLANP